MCVDWPLNVTKVPMKWDTFTQLPYYIDITKDIIFFSYGFILVVVFENRFTMSNATLTDFMYRIYIGCIGKLYIFIMYSTLMHPR